jgi:prephenate dehydrogenase
VSHLPFLLSAAYLLAVKEQPHWTDAAGLASSGFRDITRLGAGDPAMYAAIAAGNREEVLGTWAAMHEALDQLEAAIVRDEGETLAALLEEARRTRAEWLAAHPEAAAG